jgi:hypothetical protein
VCLSEFYLISKWLNNQSLLLESSRHTKFYFCISIWCICPYIFEPRLLFPIPELQKHIRLLKIFMAVRIMLFWVLVLCRIINRSQYTVFRSSAVKMESVHFSKMLAFTYKSTQHQNPGRQRQALLNIFRVSIFCL